MSCGPPALPSEGPRLLSHSPASDRPARRCCQEEAWDCHRFPLGAAGDWSYRGFQALSAVVALKMLRGAGPPIRLPGLHWAGAEQLPPGVVGL